MHVSLSASWGTLAQHARYRAGCLGTHIGCLPLVNGERNHHAACGPGRFRSAFLHRTVLDFRRMCWVSCSLKGLHQMRPCAPAGPTAVEPAPPARSRSRRLSVSPDTSRHSSDSEIQ
eukprot:3581473-Prymnesium_polylepis.2